VNKTHISLAVVGVVTLALLVLVPSVVFVIFAGLLGAVLLRAGGECISAKTGLGDKAGVGIFALAITVGTFLVFTLFAPSVAEQADQLSQSIPDALSQVAERLKQYQWGTALLERLKPEELMAGGLGNTASTAVSSTFGALGNFVIILFIGLYGALEPEVYRKGLLALFPSSSRPRGDEVLRQCGATLRSWLKAQMMSMTAVGVLTALGLWLVGLPLAALLGLIAAFLAFIPNIGPVLAALPALSLALPGGMQMMALVVLVYVVVQSVESYLITPLIQRSETSLPPALVIAVQVLFGALFGILGLALATPLCALAIVLTKELYVKDFLGGRILSADETASRADAPHKLIV